MEIQKRFTAGPGLRPSVAKTPTASGGVIVEGYGAVFWNGQPGTQYKLGRNLYERLAPTAFDSALRRGDDCRLLQEHDPALCFARTASGTMKLWTDQIGLKYRATLDPSNPLAMALISALRRGDISQSSFSFFIHDEKYEHDADGRQIRTVLDLQLFDCACVAFPAYEDTTVGILTPVGEETSHGRMTDTLRDLREQKLIAAENDIRQKQRNEAILAGMRRRVEMAEREMMTQRIEDAERDIRKARTWRN